MVRGTVTGSVGSTQPGGCQPKDPFLKRVKISLLLGSCHISHSITLNHGLPTWLSGQEPTWYAGAAGDMGLIPGSGRCLGGGHGNPLHYSCLENSMDRGAWWATVHGVAKSDTTEATKQTHSLNHRTPKCPSPTAIHQNASQDSPWPVVSTPFQVLHS